MNLRKLEIFYETSKNLNMSKTAKELFISQPSVSQAISELEDEIGVKLFDRIGKKLYLTIEGEVLSNYARRIFNLCEEVEVRIAEFKEKKRGKITLGASTTIGIYILPEIIKSFVHKFHDVEISLIVENTSIIEKMILENKIDFGFVEGYVKSEELMRESLCQDELVFITSNNHPWVGKEYITKEMIKNQKLIMREDGSGSREIVEAFFKKSNIQYKIFMELGNTEAIKKSVEAGLGIGCISEKTVIAEQIGGHLHTFKVKGEDITRDLILIYHKDKFISNIMKEFMDFSREHIGSNL